VDGLLRLARSSFSSMSHLMVFSTVLDVVDYSYDIDRMGYGSVWTILRIPSGISCYYMKSMFNTRAVQALSFTKGFRT